MIKEALLFILWGVIAPAVVYVGLAVIAFALSPAVWSAFDRIASGVVLVIVTIAVVDLIRLRVGGAHA